MKKATYILGYVFTLIFVIGAFFKLASWPQANALILIGVTGFTILFLPLVLSHRKSMKMTSVIKWTVIASLYALLFWWDLLGWPGAGEVIMLGVLILCVRLLPYFFIKLYKKSLHSS